MHQGIPLIFCVSLILSGRAYGDLKVLFKFDNSGINAHRVVKVNSLGENYPATEAELPALRKANMVMMKWMGARGQLLAVTQVPDPRVATSPEHMNPALMSRVGLIEGAWVSDGPDGTELVIIEFPRNIELGLDLETWPVSLRRDN